MTKLLLISIASFLVLTSNLGISNIAHASEEPVAVGSAPLVEWSHFEVGATRLYSSSSLYSDGPQLAFTPKLNPKRKLISWLDVAPRLDVQYNKDTAGKVNALYSLGVQVKLNMGEKFYVAPELAIWTATESSISSSYYSTGLWAGYKFNDTEGFARFFEYLALGYRRHQSTNEFNQASLIIGFEL